MGHYAKVVDTKVVNIIVAKADFFDTFVDSTPGRWIQTSYNTKGGVHSEGGTPLRKNYASVGFIYDDTRDAFIAPKPFNSWVLNEETCLWEPPIERPNDGKHYNWDEENQTWKGREEEQ